MGEGEPDLESPEAEPDTGGGPRRLTRRQVLVLGGAGGAALAGGAYLLRDLRQGGEEESTSGHHRRHQGGETEPQRTVAHPDEPPAVLTEDLPTALWSDPASWGGQVPGQGDQAMVSRPILLDVD